MIILDLPAVKLSLQCCWCKRFFPLAELRAMCFETGYELWCTECYKLLDREWVWQEEAV